MPDFMTARSSTKAELKDFLTQDQFKAIESSFVSKYGMPLETCGANGKESLSLCSSPCHPYFCRVIRDSRPAAIRCRRDRRRWMNIAMQTGRPHIGVCHAGIMLACVPVVYQRIRLGGLFFGKCLLRMPDKTMAQEFHTRFKGFRFDWKALNRVAGRLNIVPEQQLIRAGEFLQSRLEQVLVPKNVRSLQEQNALRRAEKKLKRKRLRAAIPYISESSCIRLAMEYMNHHYDRPVTLEDIAHPTGLSLFRMAHLFKETTGVTPIDYLTRVRIRNAKRLLMTTDWDCVRIGQTVGYNHASYFMRTFKRAAGTTPQQWRMRKSKHN
jgi:AraC-like DNA-binding protein/ligand-binding sensor protein